MLSKLIAIIFSLFLCANLSAIENIGIIKNLGTQEKFKHNITEVLETFKVNPVIIDYEKIID
jgi:hypothetical protein